MVQFRPFQGYVPNIGAQDKVTDRVSPPYDVISKEELAELQSHPLNVTNITLGGIDGRYEEAGRKLASWIEQGRLRKDEKESFYLYRQTFTENFEKLRRTGIIGVLRSEGYDPDGVIPHEETFSKVKEDRLNLLRGVETHCESIFCLHDGLPADLVSIMNKSATPVLEWTERQGVTHSLLRISDPIVVKRMMTELGSKRLLIADGHHRYETSVRYAQENPTDERKQFVMATLVSTDDPGLIVRPTHRLLSGMEISEDDLIDRLEEFFYLRIFDRLPEMIGALTASKETALGLWTKNERYILLVPRETDPTDMMWSVDTFVCEKVLLDKVVVPNAGKDFRISYDHDPISVGDKIQKGEADIAVILNTPNLEAIWQVALGGRVMPKKSTYFWPKIWSGFLYYRMK
ncbi:MAG TPA: DUF1015 domain-containing protein [Methanomassiliicoccales archaeon]|jgi:uncharacterized protein (DUF1015 family)